MKLLAAQEKIARTDAAARQILNDETRARQKKTARLRQLRLEKEEAEGSEDVAALNPGKSRKLAAKKNMEASPRA